MAKKITLSPALRQNLVAWQSDLGVKYRLTLMQHIRDTAALSAIDGLQKVLWTDLWDNIGRDLSNDLRHKLDISNFHRTILIHLHPTTEQPFWDTLRGTLWHQLMDHIRNEYRTQLLDTFSLGTWQSARSSTLP
jgi:hypothetical protein